VSAAAIDCAYASIINPSVVCPDSLDPAVGIVEIRDGVAAAVTRK
jgi:hypothetical protein